MCVCLCVMRDMFHQNSAELAALKEEEGKKKGLLQGWFGGGKDPK